jgi:dTDP-4-dehydrorhamnose 3,5-epimerase-like enzyme
MESLIEEPKIIKGGISVDDRGAVSYANDFNFDGVKRFYMVQNHKRGFVRAWHGHWHESKYVYVVNGSIKIGVFQLDNNLNKNSDDYMKISKTFILSSATPSVLYIPKGNANGFQTLTEDAKVMFFSTSSIEESLADDIRLPADTWNIWGDDFR